MCVCTATNAVRHAANPVSFVFQLRDVCCQMGRVSLDGAAKRSATKQARGVELNFARMFSGLCLLPVWDL